MPQFAGGELKAAIAPITVSPSGLSCEAEVFLGPDEVTKVATSGRIPFTSTGARQDVRLPLAMPAAEGSYHVYIDVHAGGYLIAAYQAIEDVVITAPYLVRDLTISRDPAYPAIYPGTTVSISVKVYSSTGGVYTVRLGGDFDAFQNIGIASVGGTATVIFDVIPPSVGTYHVTVDGLSGSFEVVAEPVSEFAYVSGIRSEKQRVRVEYIPGYFYTAEFLVAKVDVKNRGTASGTCTLKAYSRCNQTNMEWLECVRGRWAWPGEGWPAFALSATLTPGQTKTFSCPVEVIDWSAGDTWQDWAYNNVAARFIGPPGTIEKRLI